MPPRYKRREQQEDKDPYKQTELPINQPCVVYYRQSSEAQLGNISTTMQTVDMVEHLISLGWVQESIIMIDRDAGLSGSKIIEDRPGMAELMRLIEAQSIGAVAAQEVDRFFRDVTQIQTNIFIDACRRNHVLVLTPTMIYDFNHPMQGRFHMQMFRERAQQAADYIEYQIKGRLVKARFWNNERGLWAGRKIAAGYMVDDRKKLSNGERNPNYRKYVPFPVYADIIRTYFDLFQHYNGAVAKVGEHINRYGPFYPENGAVQPPEGFIYRSFLSRRSPITGQLCSGDQGLYYLLTNVVYIGHWIHQGAIQVWDNHEPIIPYDLFMYAFNRLSQTDFHGEPNPDYAPYRTYDRQPKHMRQAEEPIYNGFVFSDDVPEVPHKRISMSWNKQEQNYRCRLMQAKLRYMLWDIRADFVDRAVDEMLLQRLRITTLDESLWQEALEATQGDDRDVSHLESEIKREKSEQDNIVASLRTLSHPDMVRRAQAQYEASERRVTELEMQIEASRASQRADQRMLKARPALQRIADNWASIPHNERRNLFQVFARDVLITKKTRVLKQVTVNWKDGTESNRLLRHANYRGQLWDPADVERLRELFDRHATQKEILQAFPKHRWRNLRARYKYHFGSENLNYTRHELPYGSATRWIDTEEYQAQAHNTSNNGSTTVPGHGGAGDRTTTHRWRS